MAGCDGERLLELGEGPLAISRLEQTGGEQVARVGAVGDERGGAAQVGQPPLEVADADQRQAERGAGLGRARLELGGAAESAQGLPLLAELIEEATEGQRGGSRRSQG